MFSISIQNACLIFRFPNTDVIFFLIDTAADENKATRTKLEQLRFIMEQRRARRKARREARTSPYTTHVPATWSSEATTLVTSQAGNTKKATQGMEVDSGDSEASGDQNTLCELNSGTVVA